MKEVALKQYSNMSRRQKAKLTVLDMRLERENVFSPFGLFTLNRSTVVSCYASVVTYFIIMIQFRISEPSFSTLNNSTSTITSNETALS